MFVEKRQRQQGGKDRTQQRCTRAYCAIAHTNSGVLAVALHAPSCPTVWNSGAGNARLSNSIRRSCADRPCGSPREKAQSTEIVREPRFLDSFVVVQFQRDSRRFNAFPALSRTSSRFAASPVTRHETGRKRGGKGREGFRTSYPST